MATIETSAPARRVRPWIAALLTIFGWGVGFYYARQPRAALFWAIASVVASLILAVSAAAYAFYVDPRLFMWSAPGQYTLTIVSWALTVPVAIVAWVVAARHRTVERSGPGRLFGYLVIFLLPIIASLVLAMALRFLVLQPFRNPSGSMQPAIHVGSYMVVNKRSYGYSRYSAAPFEGLLPAGRLFPQAPRRGDIAVFRPVPEPDRDFVKRIVGMPGDRIQMIGGVLNINGAPVTRESLGLIEVTNSDGMHEQIQGFRETLPNGVSYTVLDREENGLLDNTRVFVVGPGEYFLMGDDRDNSADSRVPSVVGDVPFDNFVGRVDFIVQPGGSAH